MGVPKFFRYISERYPCLSEVVKEYQIPEFDNLYLDMNGIIHMCSHPNDFDPHFRITEEQIFKDIFHYIEILFRMIQPKRLFFMAVDGVAPRAKMNQQRGRRFRSAKEAEVLENKAREKGESLPTVERFDSNCITPGTEFMVRLHAQLKYFVTYKVSTDKIWQNVKVILSGHETPGEGEHKIMDYIRYMKSQPGYDCNTRHCLYGLDADLIMLGLCTHEPHFALLREEVKFGKKQKRITTPEETTFYLLHLSLMREYIDLEFQQLKTTLPFTYELENIIDDWVLMGFLVGNDFIPHLPDLHIDKGALPMLYQVYIQVLPTLGGYLNEGGNLRLERFQKYLEKLSEFDLEQFKDTYADIKFFESKTGRKPNKEVEEPVKDPDLAKLIEDSALALEGSDDDLAFTEDDSDDDSTFIQEFAQHKNDYYVNKLEYEKVTPEVLRSQTECYVRAIQWNLNYYYNGCCSWSWFYPHHYAPYISDIKNFSDLVLQYDLGKPFLPYQQLLAVLPAASKNLLPKPLQELMVDSESPLIEFYPTEFKTDMNGKRQEWEAVVLIPFIDQERLLAAMDLKLHRLSEEERARNRHGPMHVITYTKENLGSYIAPAYFPSLENHHAKEVKVFSEEIHVDRDRLVKSLCPGVRLDVYVPGFPTLRHIAFTAALGKGKVKVFEQASRGDNMLLKLTPQGHPDVSEVANQLIGNIIYVNWPHLSEAKVVAVSNQDNRYTKDNQDTKEGRLSVESLSPNTISQFELSMSGIETRYNNRMGVDVGKTEILVYCCTMEGKMNVFSENGKVSLEKQWSKFPAPYALQTTVRDIAVYDPVCVQQKSLEEVFPVDSVCFVLTPPHYGYTAVVKDSTKNDSIKLNVFVPVEPDLTSVQKSIPHLRTRYMFANNIAQRLGIGTNLLSRITGNIFVTTETNYNLNIGLNLKFSKRNQEVCGFTRRENGQWLYSSKALDLVRDYMVKFPDLFEFLSQNINNEAIQVAEVFPENTSEKLAELTVWLKEQPGAKAEKQTCGADILEEVIVEAIERVVDDCIKSNFEQKTLPLDAKPTQLYQPKVNLGKLCPDSSAQHQVFDRIVCVRECYTVPLGSSGTIIGIHVAEREVDVMYDILFDNEFAGGLKLRCSSNRGYRMSGQGLINISYGKRVEAAKLQKPTAVVTPSGPSRGHNSAFASWRFKPAPSKNLDVTPFMKALEAITIQKQEDEAQTQTKTRTSRSSQPAEAKNEFQAMWTELQKAGQNQQKVEKSKPKTDEQPSEVPQQDPSSIMLKKMLKIADDCTGKAKVRPEEKPLDSSYIVQLMTYFQKRGFNLPTYQYINNKDGFTAQVFCNNRSFFGAPASVQEKAAENAAKVALDFFKEKEYFDKTSFGLNYQAPPAPIRPPLLPNPQQIMPARLIMGRGCNGNWNTVPTPPTPPQQWYQQHQVYHLPSDNMPMNWQQRMVPSIGTRVPNFMNVRGGHVPPFQPPPPNVQQNPNCWQMTTNPFVPLQADKKMRQFREVERVKDFTSKESHGGIASKGKNICDNPRSSTSLSNSSQSSKRKSRIAAKFNVPLDDTV